MKKSVRSSTSSLTTYVQATPVSGDSLIMPCAHEEEDVRMLLHVCHAAKQGVTKAMIRTVNTDVPEIAIGKCESLGLNELWMACGVADKFRSLQSMTFENSLVPLSVEPNLFPWVDSM